MRPTLRVICNNKMCFYIDAETLDPVSASCYDPYDPIRGVEYISFATWAEWRAEQRYEESAEYWIRQRK